MMKLNSLKILVLLLGWLSVQSAALSHEFSEEHWSSSAGHLCLTQAVHLDDIVPSHDSSKVASIEYEFVVQEFETLHAFSQQSFPPCLSRAPPKYS
ncbi:MAG: hypothetical protein OQJ89_14345 [Kangiellaceae bacterium]|nr:hypothetical protein [Kangiellaceae bacterium]MCW9000971.1 hypothetical protein [Kangiellaceae bacterium]MCW9018146.1 hypothetical protein [Kangiellaceae bacterium]